MADESPTQGSTDKALAKKATPKKRAKKGASKAKTAKTTKPSRTYPTITLQKCLIIAQKIKELNGGNPWAPREVSRAIKIGNTSKFFYYCAASRDFGVTIGSSNTEEITLTELGRQLVYAPDPETEEKKKLECFLKIDIFKNVLDYYKGNNLPDMKYLGNTLEDKFKLPPEFHEEFSKIFRENCNDLNIKQGIQSENGVFNKIQPDSATIIVGASKKSIKTGLKAFVIMPFIEKYDKRPVGFFKEVLNSLLIPAGVEAGFTIETANKQGSDVIHSTIINELLEADLVIADLTDHNPNVLFELGMRMHADLPVALIKTSDTGKIFDVDNMLRVHEYNPNLWKSTIETDVKDLIEHFKAAWDNRASEQTYMKILRRSGT